VRVRVRVRVRDMGLVHAEVNRVVYAATAAAAAAAAASIVPVGMIHMVL